MHLASSIVSTLLLVCAICPTQDSKPTTTETAQRDEILADAARARESYAQALRKAEADYGAEFTSIKTAIFNRDDLVADEKLNRSLQMAAETRASVENGVAPKCPELAKADLAYKNAVANAQRMREAAYEAAAQKALRAGEEETARLISNERREVLAGKAPRAPTPSRKAPVVSTDSMTGLRNLMRRWLQDRNAIVVPCERCESTGRINKADTEVRPGWRVRQRGLGSNSVTCPACNGAGRSLNVLRVEAVLKPFLAGSGYPERVFAGTTPPQDAPQAGPVTVSAQSARDANESGSPEIVRATALRLGWTETIGSILEPIEFHSTDGMEWAVVRINVAPQTTTWVKIGALWTLVAPEEKEQAMRLARSR